MGYKHECIDCGNEFERSYLSLPKCPKCGSGKLLLVKPSRETGLILFGLGLLLLAIFWCDICTLFSAGVEGTIIGSLVRPIFGRDIAAYRIVTTVVAFLSIPITIVGAAIAFGKRK
jgi:DNA-directed RNA polymerase subunit RPC12/RpoP